MRERRFSITKGQAETIRLSLLLLINDLQNTKSPYAKYQLERAKDIHKKLSEYEWRKA